MPAQRGPVLITGQGRELVNGRSGDLRVELAEGDLTITLDGQPTVAAYRDVTTIAVQQRQVLLVVGDGALRLVIDGLGDRLGLLLGELRDRRARQVLGDRLIELPAGEAIELCEYRAADEHGVAQLAYHSWGAALLPLDERQSWRLIRRAAIERVDADISQGTLRVTAMARPGQAGPTVFELGSLGAATEQHRGRMAGLRTAALADAGAIVAQLLPDAPFALRQAAGARLVDGRPVDRSELADAWPAVESAVLSEPTFAAAYRTMLERGGGPAWLALAPRQPGEREHVAWFFVALPGNLVAMEIVSSGAHATYLFRVVPRGEYGGQPPTQLAGAALVAVTDVSEALIDMRFLRQPIYLTPAQLAEPRHLRDRLAIAALPSLKAARARFVGRLIHRDEESWARSLDDAITWHATASDDGAPWTGGAAADETEEIAGYQPAAEHSTIEEGS